MTLSPNNYHGFSLSSVCWGYRDIFAKALDGLYEKQWIGEHRPEVTDAFFGLMQCAEEQHFDYVLKEFLGALNPQTAWLMDLPGIFVLVTDMGRQLAEAKLHYGITYFRALAEGGFGRSPQDVRYLLTTLSRLRTVDDDLAMSFLHGFPMLSARLTRDELDVYVRQGLQAYQHNHKTGLRFMEGTLKSSEAIIQSLTQECRLDAIGPQIEKLLRALVGYEVEVGELSRLDSDTLIERGTQVVCLYRWLYVPACIRAFERARQNCHWFQLLGVVAAGMLALNSFPRIHGHPAYQTCTDVVGSRNHLRVNLFQIVEFARVLRGIRRMWPGACSLLDFGIETEFSIQPPSLPADKLCVELLQCDLADTGESPVASALLDVADVSVNVFDTVELLTDDLVAAARNAYPGLDVIPLRVFTFLPDFLYPGGVSQPPSDKLVADLKQTAKQRQQARERKSDDQLKTVQPGEDANTDAQGDEDAREKAVAACFLYDEWSQDEHDYYTDYCHVYEKRPPISRHGALSSDVTDLVAQTRRVFEMLRPEFTKEKYLDAGDRINADLLTDYLVLRKQEPSPKVNFYEKPLKNQRSLATLVLLDVSGSTGSTLDRQKIIEIEKQAALILGQGLSTLGDRFSICGFSGNGREQCEFFIFKDFAERWDQASIARVLSAYPRSATRMGVALRHAGYRLSAIDAQQRLILLVTDGKPMDTGYDPNTRYAHYDVRMACEENMRQSIHTFCISTEENSHADMELMFPNHRFAILPDVKRLPRILPKFYVQLTV